MDVFEKVVLWDAINLYVKGCGGDPSMTTVGIGRMDAVVAVERVMDNLLGARDTLIKNLQQVAIYEAGHDSDCPVVHGASVDCAGGKRCPGHVRTLLEKAQLDNKMEGV